MIVINDILKNQDLNSGVLIFKNDAWSKEFFGAVWESRHDFIPGEGCTKLAVYDGVQFNPFCDLYNLQCFKFCLKRFCLKSFLTAKGDCQIDVHTTGRNCTCL